MSLVSQIGLPLSDTAAEIADLRRSFPPLGAGSVQPRSTDSLDIPTTSSGPQAVQTGEAVAVHTRTSAFPVDTAFVPDARSRQGRVRGMDDATVVSSRVTGRHLGSDLCQNLLDVGAATPRRPSRFENPFKLAEDGGEVDSRERSGTLYRGWVRGNLIAWDGVADDSQDLHSERLNWWCHPTDVAARSSVNGPRRHTTITGHSATLVGSPPSLRLDADARQTNSRVITAIGYVCSEGRRSTYTDGITDRGRDGILLVR